MSNAAALAVLSSDALSSVAYATEEILLVLVAAGSSALSLSLPIAIAIIVLLAIVVLSYRQTIRAYPQGGGSYIVAKENLGIYPGLVAGGSLMIDYILSNKLQQKWRQLEADIPLVIVGIALPLGHRTNCRICHAV